VLDWIEGADIESGALLRRINKGGGVQDSGLTGHAVGNLVKACAVKAGFEASEFAGHSLRSGFLTAAAHNGASVWKMMEVSRHRSVEAVQGYVNAAEGFQEHAGEGLL
jgi:site-specific recombinase XerD